MRARLARWLPRLVALAVVVTCAATAVVTLQDRADEVAAEEAALRRTAADARATAAEATRTATLLEELEEVRLAGAADVRAARRDGSVADQVTLLRRLLEAAQAQILDVRQLSDAQREQLDVLRGCVATLDRVRARLAAGDTRGAISNAPYFAVDRQIGGISAILSFDLTCGMMQSRVRALQSQSQQRRADHR